MPGWLVVRRNRLLRAGAGDRGRLGLGGFERRTDLLRKSQPGTLITTGPYEFRFTEATAQAKTDTAGAITAWEIIMIGEARTTGDTSIESGHPGDRRHAGQQGRRQR